ncbi:MAG: NAD(P)-dependent oxidoreductase [Alphaproteobacteria bacterium]|nr:NAD(P)-dependent oxidoreductase [Alphaproteobacteria bacterium]MCW5744210.1 NAD(P)-dependent oxidoreductase [Alphaproteobacteria bacterium]
MRALVTGATGFVGRTVVGSLKRRGVDVVTLGRQANCDIQADLLDDAPLDEAMRGAAAEALIHVAWYAEHGKFWTAPVNTQWVAASERLADAFCRAGGRRLVGVGTCAEYEWSEHTCCVEGSTPLRAATLYGASKHQANLAMEAVCAAHGVPFAWARLFIPIGKGEPAGRLIPSVIAALRGEREPFAIGGVALRDFLHVGDAGEALATLATSDGTGAFNVGAGQPTQIADMVDHLAAVLGKDAEPLRRLYALRPGEPASLYGDTTRLRALGWSPQVSIQAALDLMLR